MLNSKPNNHNYHQGNFVPKNIDKVIKLNANGGIYYRSGLELKMMVYLDQNNKIIRWAAESIEIPYLSKEYQDGMVINKQRRYFPDFYYEMKIGDDIKKVIAEVKPKSEYEDAVLFNDGKFTIKENLSMKKMKNIEFKFKAAQKNASKWNTMIEFCNKKGYEFIIITDEILNRI